MCGEEEVCIWIIPLHCRRNIYPDHSTDQTIPAVPCTVMLNVQCTLIEYVVVRLNFYNLFHQQCGAGKLIHQGYFIYLFIYLFSYTLTYYLLILYFRLLISNDILFNSSCLYSLNFQCVVLVLCHLQDLHIEVGNVEVKAQREARGLTQMYCLLFVSM